MAGAVPPYFSNVNGFRKGPSVVAYAPMKNGVVSVANITPVVLKASEANSVKNNWKPVYPAAVKAIPGAFAAVVVVIL